MIDKETVISMILNHIAELDKSIAEYSYVKSTIPLMESKSTALLALVTIMQTEEKTINPSPN